MMDRIQARIAAVEQRFGTPAVVTLPPAAAPFDAELAAAVAARTTQPAAARGGFPGAVFATMTGPATSPYGLAKPVGGTGLPAAAAPYRALFEAAGARYGVDPALLAAVAWTESGFRPDAVSHAGAQGLMQIMPGTAAALGVDPRDPAQAVDGAARYLRDQLRAFGDVRLALAAYNAGPGAVQAHGGIPPYPETQAYVAKVLGHLQAIGGSR